MEVFGRETSREEPLARSIHRWKDSMKIYLVCTVGLKWPLLKWVTQIPGTPWPAERLQALQDGENRYCVSVLFSQSVRPLSHTSQCEVPLAVVLQILFPSNIHHLKDIIQPLIRSLLSLHKWNASLCLWNNLLKNSCALNLNINYL